MVVLGLGSNTGNRLGYLSEAVNVIRRTILTATTLSPIYESEALLKENAPDAWNKPFLNMVVIGQTHFLPEQLLKGIKCIEKTIGRKNRGKWAPREIDIDIIAYNNQVIDSPTLTIPHKELLSRCFVVRPFADIAPNWRYPQKGENAGKTIHELSKKLPVKSHKTHLAIIRDNEFKHVA